MPEIRRIRPEERAAALDTLVAAFRNDPQIRWWFPDDHRYSALAERFFGVLLDTRMEGGEVWVTEECRAVSLWLPPGGNLIGPDAVELRYHEMLAGLPEFSAHRIRRTDDLVDRLLPLDPHWYLGVLASHPDHRGRGLGNAVTAPVLAAADRAGLPVALQTSSSRNVRYYTRRGFAVTHRAQLVEPVAELALRMADGGGSGASTAVLPVRETVLNEVTMYVMVRQPR